GVLTALHCAAGSRLGAKQPSTAAGLLETAELLLAAGADARATARSWAHDVGALYFVIGSGQVAMLELLLDHGLDPTEGVSTAVWNDREDILDLLLARGARLDDAHDETKPVLNNQVRWGRFTQARLLLRKGASPNLPDEQGWTAVHQAVSRGNVKILGDLLAAGGDVARRDKDGLTPRDLARAWEREDLLRVLGRG
ncbi:MAG TPA: ankyrin repeat domain-containing protein, partial [Candidatus Polarisedimenticolaceae bacterium]|nr:ankyrin repeat domain-containing protein [Candidatus Polarisedimenticolaceae bacterium]